MIHYTLNTGHTYDTRLKSFDLGAIAFFDPVIKALQQNPQYDGVFPKPFEGYRLKATLEKGFALFDISGKNLLSANAVAWLTETESVGWETFRRLFIKLENAKQVKVSNLPVKPANLPWLSTVTIDNPEVFFMTWLPDIEQCFAKALIQNFTKLKPVR